MYNWYFTKKPIYSLLERAGGVRYVSFAWCAGRGRGTGAQHQRSCATVPLSLENIPYHPSTGTVYVYGGRRHACEKETPPEGSVRGAQLRRIRLSCRRQQGWAKEVDQKAAGKHQQTRVGFPIITRYPFNYLSLSL